MTKLPTFTTIDENLDAIAALEGAVAVIQRPDAGMDKLARRVNRLTRGALARLLESDAFTKLEQGKCIEIRFPHGMAAERVLVLKLDRNPASQVALAAGAGLVKAAAGGQITVLAGAHKAGAQLLEGMWLRGYEFTKHKAPEKDKPKPLEIAFMLRDSGAFRERSEALRAVCEGVYFTRDLVNEPANVLTTEEFAERLTGMRELGLEVTVLDEDDLRRLGMHALLGVGQGSATPSKVVEMRWRGDGDARPLALVGKGVVFDTGGISIKPAGGMEEMTMDMGGAGVVAGVMHTLAQRKAKAHVVGLVGLVENMPDGKAQRPGDIVRSMKGDTIEVINTDAEGRLVLADVLWYAQQHHDPVGVIDLATLTGAIIIGLGHENAGVFSNDDGFCEGFQKAARAEGEGAWRMPMGKAYDRQLKSRLADMKNVGGRPGGAITAAQFLARFIKEGTPWIHLDIAGVALLSKESDLAPAGPTGWGVRALNRMIADGFEDGGRG